MEGSRVRRGLLHSHPAPRPAVGPHCQRRPSADDAGGVWSPAFV